MYAQFDIWRSSAGYEAPLPQPSVSTSQPLPHIVPSHAPPPYQEPATSGTQMTGQDNTNSSTDSYMDIAYMLQVLLSASIVYIQVAYYINIE